MKWLCGETAIITIIIYIWTERLLKVSARMNHLLIFIFHLGWCACVRVHVCVCACELRSVVQWVIFRANFSLTWEQQAHTEVHTTAEFYSEFYHFGVNITSHLAVNISLIVGLRCFNSSKVKSAKWSVKIRRIQSDCQEKWNRSRFCFHLKLLKTACSVPLYVESHWGWSWILHLNWTSFAHTLAFHHVSWSSARMFLCFVPTNRRMINDSSPSLALPHWKNKKLVLSSLG